MKQLHHLVIGQSQLRRLLGVPEDATSFQVGNGGPFEPYAAVDVWWYSEGADSAASRSEATP